MDHSNDASSYLTGNPKMDEKIKKALAKEHHHASRMIINHIVQTVQIDTIIPTEHDEAIQLATYLETLQTFGKVLVYAHIPNETYTTSRYQKQKNTQEGVKAGIPDYIIVTATEVLFLELKRIKNSNTSDAQKEWLLHLKGKTTDSILAKGFTEAKAYIDSHL